MLLFIILYCKSITSLSTSVYNRYHATDAVLQYELSNREQSYDSEMYLKRKIELCHTRRRRRHFIVFNERTLYLFIFKFNTRKTYYNSVYYCE